jgi:hypothetical protein
MKVFKYSDNEIEYSLCYEVLITWTIAWSRIDDFDIILLLE